MTATAPLAFLNPATSTGSPGTLAFDQKQVVSNTARFAMDGAFTSAVAPNATTGASRLLAGGARPFVDINNPTDGLLFYIGSATVTPATGVPIYPGSRIQMSGYIGPVWVVSADPTVPTTFFYRVS